jgi:hypothetical protein
MATGFAQDLYKEVLKITLGNQEIHTIQQFSPRCTKCARTPPQLLFALSNHYKTFSCHH